MLKFYLVKQMNFVQLEERRDERVGIRSSGTSQKNENVEEEDLP
jgi:hypothetical protein